MKRVLSTKILSSKQYDLLEDKGFYVEHHDFINTQELYFDWSSFHKIKNAIFTSKRAVTAVFSKPIEIQNCFCVGERTAKLLQEKGQHVIEVAHNAKDLSERIINNYLDYSFYYFCAKHPLPYLPNILDEFHINWQKVPVYAIVPNSMAFSGNYDAVLFFSPSGVKSYFLKNNIPNWSFCIGATTAKTLEEYTQKYTSAQIPSVEHVLECVLNYFKSHD